MEIEQFIQEQIKNTTGKIVIQAGHFSLVHDKDSNAVIPAIITELEKDNKSKLVQAVTVNPYMGVFPEETWAMGARLAKFAQDNNKDFGLLVLVNDWQWVPKSEFGQENTYRSDFYSAYRTLPGTYKDVLDNHGVAEENVVSFKNHDGTVNHPIFFSESKLRSRFDNYYSDTCNLEGNSCAQEIVPLVKKLYDDGVSLFIDFIPDTCKNPINSGVREAKKQYAMDTLTTINVFSHGKDTESFWNSISYEII